MNKPVTASTGLTTVGARTYDPVLGKFLSVDPVIDTNLPQQNTGYTYSGNNPTTYMDPTGLRLDQGCGWGVNCSRRPASSPQPKPSPFTNVVVQVLSDGTPIYQRRPNPNYRPRPVTSSIWGPTTRKPSFNYTSLSDFARSGAMPKTQTLNKKPSKPGWGPLVEVRMRPGDTKGVWLSGCAGICATLSINSDLSGSASAGVGPRAGWSAGVGVSSPSKGGFFTGGTCSLSLGPVGGYAQMGVQNATPEAPSRFSGGGIALGAGGGCSADIGVSWEALE
ncbi:RHS repeat-associated core domain-containing protein [Microbacterium foliorum]|uniref:RHS repeat-associated core domain-containing protein n=1 Tax=Microbacterium foliorum TaxID=104336 RepID=UPI00358DCBCB